MPSTTPDPIALAGELVPHEILILLGADHVAWIATQPEPAATCVTLALAVPDHNYWHRTILSSAYCWLRDMFNERVQPLAELVDAARAADIDILLAGR